MGLEAQHGVGGAGSTTCMELVGLVVGEGLGYSTPCKASVSHTPAFIQDKVMEMTLDGDDKQQEAAKSPPAQVPLPLVGGGVATNDEDSDTDSGSVGDIDDYELEEDDPVSVGPDY